jgi:hypothetical protein
MERAMSDARQPDRLPLLGGWTRNFAALMLFIGTLVLCVTAGVTSWPLGPGYVDEGGITTIRLAVAALALGVEFGVLFLGFFMFDIVVRLKRLDERSSKPPDRPDASA